MCINRTWIWVDDTLNSVFVSIVEEDHERRFEELEGNVEMMLGVGKNFEIVLVRVIVVKAVSSLSYTFTLRTARKTPNMLHIKITRLVKHSFPNVSHGELLPFKITKMESEFTVHTTTHCNRILIAHHKIIVHTCPSIHSTIGLSRRCDAKHETLTGSEKSASSHDPTLRSVSSENITICRLDYHNGRAFLFDLCEKCTEGLTVTYLCSSAKREFSIRIRVFYCDEIEWRSEYVGVTVRHDKERDRASRSTRCTKEYKRRRTPKVRW